MEQTEEERRNNELKSLFLDNLKYSTRRYDVVSLIFTGFGLYANYELFKSADALNVGTAFLIVSFLLLVVLAYLNLYVLKLDINLQVDSFKIFQNITWQSHEVTNKLITEVNEFEKRQKFKRGIIYVGLIITTVLTLVGFVVLSLL